MNSVIKSEENHELSTDLNVITAEIRAYQRVAGEAIFEIGRRLKHVKENDLAHGEWTKWCEEELGMKRQQADMFIKVVEELGDEFDKSFCHLGLSALYHIATLPPAEREKPHKIPTTGEVKTVDEMTVRELREVKKALKEAEKRAELERKERERLERENEELSKQPPKIEYVEVKDELMERKLKRYEELFGDLTIYEGKATRVTNGDAITYAVFEFSEDVRKFLEKYSYLTHFAREFNEMIDEGKEEYQKSIDALRRFLQAVERNLNEKELIILEG